MLSSCLKVHMMLTYNVFGFVLIFPHCIFDQLNLMLYICMCLIVTDNVQVSIKVLFCSVHKTGLSELTQIELNHKMLNIVHVVTFHVYNFVFLLSCLVL